MAHVIPFPERKMKPARMHDALARDIHSHDYAPSDTQQQAQRIADQVEHEIAQQAARMATGARMSRVTAPKGPLRMPGKPVKAEPKSAMQTMADVAKTFFGR